MTLLRLSDDIPADMRATLTKEACSGRGRPCHYEAMPGRLPNPTTTKCPLREYCTISAAGLASFAMTYRKDHLVVGLTESSASIVVRSDQQFTAPHRDPPTGDQGKSESRATTRFPPPSQEEARRTVRKHLFALRAGRQDPRVFLSRHGIDDVRCAVETKASLRHILSGQFWTGLEELLKKQDEQGERLRCSHVKALCHDDRATDAIAKKFASPLQCFDFDAEIEATRYLGFVDLRRGALKRPLDIAVLAPPAELLEKRKNLALGDYGPLFGGVSFEGSFYCVVEGKVGGMTCAEACATMALGQLASPERPSLVAGFELSCLARSRTDDVFRRRPAAPKNGERKCIADGKESFVNVGRTCGELYEVLKAVKTVSSGMTIFAENGDANKPYAGTDRALLGMLQACVREKVATILHVKTVQWHKVLEDQFKLRELTGKIEPGHCVVVVGVLGSNDPENARLVIHDPSGRPFLTLPFKDVICAARAYPAGGVAAAFASTPARRRSLACIRTWRCG